MTLDEKLQVAVIIDKQSRSWKDLKKKNLRHNTKEFSLDSLVTCLCIEKEFREQDNK